MESGQPRGRSPSQGNRHHISPGPSPHYHDAVAALDPSISEPTFTAAGFETAPDYSAPYFASSSQPPPPSGTADAPFYSSTQFNPGAFPENQFDGQTLDPSFGTDEYMYADDHMHGDFEHDFPLNPSFNVHQHANINPADLTKMSSPPDQTSPNLLSPERHSSPGQPASPTSTNGQFYTPQHSRHQSLDPSAAYGQTDWQGAAFQQHRRAPSDHSDVSSNAASPYVAHQELLQSVENGHSPFLPAQVDAGNSYGMEGFSLNEQQTRSSPGHSPYISPRLLPSQSQGLGIEQDVLLQQGHMGLPSRGIYPSPPDATYPHMGQMHSRNLSAVSDMGQADQYAVPSISVDPAPVSRQASFGPDGPDASDSLSPPQRGARGRSQSDVTLNRGPLSRSASPLGRSRPATLHASDSLSVRSTSPRPAMSRESSPGLASGRIDKNRRASTSSITSREYILDLADPARPNPSHSSTRVQKHPANFQCHLCTKRFTRAYNLRSHLRTHTDERPYVCTVCGKAFARQHDRKRHEGLHSGEKKFVCKGELHSSPGQHWGCGRRFARADALGRHFRSEAGRVCIKPLLDEEAVERRHKMMAEQQAANAQFAQSAGGLQPVPQSMMFGADPATGQGGFTLPAALLVQYPMLQNLDWAHISAQGADDGELSDVGMGQPSFDASSGGEGYYDDDDGYISGGGDMGYGHDHMGSQSWV